MASAVEAAGFALHTEDGDVVTALIATIEKLAGGVEVEAARIVPTSWLVSDVGQLAIFADGEDRHAVVQSIARIDEPAIGGDEYLGAKITAAETGR